jgi:hypothetical protein
MPANSASTAPDLGDDIYIRYIRHGEAGVPADGWIDLQRLTCGCDGINKVTTTRGVRIRQERVAHRYRARVWRRRSSPPFLEVQRRVASGREW